MKIIFSVFITFISFVALNQVLLLSDPDYNQANPLNCSGIIPPPPSGTNFSDGAGNYAPNMDEVLVLCPDLTQGSKVSIAFATNIGFEFNIDPSDTLFIYDGPTTSAPLLGAYNSGTNPIGFYVQASFANNPSGCLTLRFVSNGTNEGTGWVANVACGDIPQPYVPHIEAFKNGVGPNILNPLDTGYVDLCFGDSVLLVATPTFPYASEVTGTGYSQTVANCTYLWTIGGSGQSTGSSVWFTPPARSGYYVDLKITDAFPQIVNINCKVRVAQLPIFAGTGPLEDSVCLGENTNLIGGVTAQDTVGVTVPGGEYQVGGIFAGLTFLPDGAGQQYETSIGISGFDQTTFITSSANFDQLCLDIEHSYIGDIEITLTCPNGTTVSIMNAYNGTPFGWTALVPGGCGSGIGTSLGNDTNIDGGAPGSPVWSYCFSPTNATLGTICAENTAGNTIPNDYTAGGINLPNGTTGNNIAMDTNGVYLPDGNFNDFIGCPVNGNWTITVQDNQGIDDGYIFQWGIYFNASLYPETEGYQNTILSDFWSPDPTITSGQNDTLITIQPNVPGNTFYTYNVTDNFGCAYDTTVTLYVIPLPDIFSDTTVCNVSFQVAGTTAVSGGVWSSSAANLTFSPNAITNNPLITLGSPGTYPVTFTDNACSYEIQSEITFLPTISPTFTQVNSYCIGDTIPPLPTSSINGFSGTWSPAINNTDTTTYTFTPTAGQCASTSTMSIIINPNIPPLFTPVGPYCSEEQIAPLPTNSSNGISGTWSPAINNTATTTYTFNPTAGLCAIPSTMSITINPRPTIDIDPIACGYVYQVTGTTAFNGGTWSSSDPLLINFSDSLANNPQISADYAGIYSVSFTDKTCIDTLTEDIEFLSEIYATIPDTNICVGASFALNPTFGNKDIVTYNPVLQYYWEDGSTEIPRIISQAGSYVFTVKNYCYDTTVTSKIGTKPCDITTPNIIVLSSTEGNNFFSVNTIGIVEFNCVILNRWGNVIYEYNDPEGGWNGKTSNGNLVEEGTYFYRIKATYEGGEDVIKHGFVVLKY